MKIGIITFHFVNNQGALLQCFALKKVLEKNGHDVSVIDYRPGYHSERYATVKNPFKVARWYYRKYGNWPVLRRIVLYIKVFLKSIIEDLKHSRDSSEGTIDDFAASWFNLTKRYISLAALKKEPPECDAYVCGSDQIWNPDVLNQEYDEAYFLQFGEPNVKRVAYAASMGRAPKISEISDLNGLCKDFTAISLREYDAKTIAEMDRTVHICLDPTLLLDRSDFDTVKERINENGPFVFVYGFETNEKIKTAVDAALKKYNCKIINGSPERINLDVDCIRVQHYSPSEFLSYIEQAACVVTNSFHGTALSIIYHKDFICVPHTTRGNRMTDLLGKLRLENRIWNGQESDIFIEEKIDYVRVEDTLRELRQDSLKFLLDALSCEDKYYNDPSPAKITPDDRIVYGGGIRVRQN